MSLLLFFDLGTAPTTVSPSVGAISFSGDVPTLTLYLGWQTITDQTSTWTTLTDSAGSWTKSTDFSGNWTKK